MPGKPAARLGDAHTCPAAEGPKPHTGGPIIPPCCTSVLIGGPPAARVGDKATCVGPLDVIAKGSPTVFIGRRPAARMGDKTAHGGVIVKGEFTVLIGGGKGSPAPGTTVESYAGKVGDSHTFSDPETGKNSKSKAPKESPVKLDPHTEALLAELEQKKIITIEAPLHKEAIRKHLRTVASTPTGAATLAKIAHSGKKVSILWNADVQNQPDCCFPENQNWRDATKRGYPVRDMEGKPEGRKAYVEDGKMKQGIPTGTGEGANAVIVFDPDSAYENNQPGAEPMPTDAVLWHELEHSSQIGYGRINAPPAKRYDNREERRVINESPPNEASYLKERGYEWKRTSHKLVWESNS